MGFFMRVDRKLLRLAGALALAASLGGCIGYNGDFDRGYQIDDQAVAKVLVPSRKATDPVGVPAPGESALTVAVNVTAWP